MCVQECNAVKRTLMMHAHSTSICNRTKLGMLTHIGGTPHHTHRRGAIRPTQTESLPSYVYIYNFIRHDPQNGWNIIVCIYVVYTTSYKSVYNKLHRAVMKHPLLASSSCAIMIICACIKRCILYTYIYIGTIYMHIIWYYRIKVQVLFFFY